ncbi:Putative serine/threonine-protein kinase, active [Septoria linicola]|uniref:Serine/threonine-protein kinase, active n=1 Tax=Septoria linicola TaxID=215465 RepID=A0A9Q9ANV7_9PEZI|nr:Putative serine/threonine-protein kinase, active [Septoria linicola]
MALALVQPREVGLLSFRNTAAPDVHRMFPLFADVEFEIGREMVLDAIGVEDRCISKHHLKIHCVKYQDDDEQVAPMVWARVLSNNAIIFNRFGLDDEDGGVLVGKDQGAFLLNEWDSIQLTSKIWIDFTLPDGHRSKPPKLDISQKAEVGIFAHRYRLTTRVLGIGGYAKVHVASNEKTGKQLACKIVKQAGNDDEGHYAAHRTKDFIAREFIVLKKLSHPNIIALEAVISTPYNVYIFQDLVTGGDLLSHAERNGPMEEAQAAIILRQLLEAVKYLHDNQIVHRDIKPENILMTSWKAGGRIVLTDFGQSRTIVDLENAAKKAGVFRMQTLVGTLGYAAPELVRLHKQTLEERSGYSKAVDIWSVGCVACTLLGSDVLFPEVRNISAASITKDDYDARMYKFHNGREWLNVGRRAKAFIQGCLTFEEDSRLTAIEALASEWLTHPHYRAEMDAAYQRAIADWKPKVYEEDELIEHMDTTLHVEKAQAKAEVRSRHFAPDPSPDSVGVEAVLAQQLHASPLVPDTPHAHREESAQYSLSIPHAPAIGSDDEYGEDMFQHMDSGEYNDGGRSPRKHQNQYQDSVGSVPAPPAFTQRKKVVR